MLGNRFWNPLLVVLLQVLLASCLEKNSLTFVIDDTLSMQDVINQVKNASEKIMDIILGVKSSQIENLVLVTFNDPDAKLLAKGRTRQEVLPDLHDIYVHNQLNGDCPEYAMKGVELGLKHSRPGSSLYVFTDATAKDHMIIPSVINLCQKTQSTVTFILSKGICLYHSKYLEFVKKYYEVAKACSGSVIEVDGNDIKRVLKWIEILTLGETSVVKTIEAPSNGKNIPFTVDDQTEYALIIATGPTEDFTVRDQNFDLVTQDQLKKVTWLTTFKALQLKNPTPGTYYVSVTSNIEIIIKIVARTDFLFEHGFSQLLPKTINETTKQPIGGTTNHLSILISDPSNAVSIKSVEILTMKDEVIRNMTLKKMAVNFYITEPFESPTFQFKIVVFGVVNQSGRPIYRVGKVPVQPQPKPKVIDSKMPEITISEGKLLYLNYGSNVTLTCKVSAYPQPNVTWRGDRGKLLSTKLATLVQVPYEYVDYLTLHHVTKPREISCIAENNLKTTEKSIKIQVASPFTINDHSTGDMEVDYGSYKILKCNVNSLLPMRIRWYFISDNMKDKKLLTTSDKVVILDDGKVLGIHIKDLYQTGEYSCEASLIENENQKITIKTFVRVAAQSPTIIDKNYTIIKVKENFNADISCKVKKTSPPPKISWQFAKGSSHNFNNLPDSEPLEEQFNTYTMSKLKIKNTLIYQTGQYKCIVKNDLGQDEKITELIVYKRPVATIVGNPEKSVDYGSKITLTCLIVAHPIPSITMNCQEYGGVLAYDNNKAPIEEYGFNYSRTLHMSNIRKPWKCFCIAENNQGKDVVETDISVLSPFVVHSPKYDFKYLEYGKEATLLCEVTSRWPMRVTWYKFINGTNRKEAILPSKTLVLSANKKELVIPFMDLPLEGQYLCEAVLDFDSLQKVELVTDVKISGLDAPQIEKNINLVKVHVNNSKTINCKITKGGLTTKVTWQWRPKDSEWKQLNHSGEQLHIENVKLSDAGLYKCVAKNLKGVDQHDIELIVQYPPVIITNVTEYVGVVGDAYLRIPCKVTGYPAPTITWYEGQTLLVPGGNYSIDESDLLIKNLTQNESLNFTCQATNEFGTGSKMYHVAVNDYLVNYGVQKTLYLKKDEKPNEDDKVLECPLDTTTPESIRWFLDGFSLKNVRGRSIKIDNYKDSNYTCRVSDEQSTKSYTFVLNIGYPPFFTSVDKIITWTGDAEELVNCKVQAKPPAKIEWFFNDKILELQSNNLELLPIIDWGNYTCRASNVHDFVIKTVTVESQDCLINKRTDITSYSPVTVLRDEYGTITWPKYETGNDYIVVMSGQKLTLFCPGRENSPNKFRMFNTSEIDVFCDHQDEVIINGTAYKVSDLLCESANGSTTILSTGVKCFGDNTVMLRVGFQATHFVPVYEVCYDTIRGMAHKVLAMDKRWDELYISNPEWFYYPGFGSMEKDKLYTCGTHSTSCCYAKSQLLNAQEVAYGITQLTTYIENINTIPEWRPCENSSRGWNHVTERIIDTRVTFPKLNVISGVSFTSKSEAVPRYLWKLLKKGGDMLALVYVNVPSPINEDIRCNEPCDSELYDILRLNHTDKFTYCCNHREFVEKIQSSKNNKFHSTVYKPIKKKKQTSLLLPTKTFFL